MGYKCESAQKDTNSENLQALAANQSTRLATEPPNQNTFACISKIQINRADCWATMSWRTAELHASFGVMRAMGRTRHLMGFLHSEFAFGQRGKSGAIEAGCEKERAWQRKVGVVWNLIKKEMEF